MSNPRTSPNSKAEARRKRDIKELAQYIQSNKCKKIVLMLGAGVSTSAGIPDFRSPKTGLYANLARLNLPNPEAVFEINFFRRNPVPFYTLASELYPGSFRPTPTHSFIKLLDTHSLLHMCFTQNIDTLERRAGVPEEKIIEAHGSFATQRCINCRTVFPGEVMKEIVLGTVEEQDEDDGSEEKKGRWKEKGGVKIPQCVLERCSGIVKPDIVFFGEGLPDRFVKNIEMVAEADLLIIMGTSLTVHPFASLAQLSTSQCRRVLINLERVGDLGRKKGDVVLLGSCDDIVKELAEELGWTKELDEAWAETEATVETKRPLKPAKSEKEREEENKDSKKGVKDEVEEIVKLMEKKLDIQDQEKAEDTQKDSVDSIKATEVGEDGVSLLLLGLGYAFIPSNMVGGVSVAETQRPQPTTLSFKSLPGQPEGILVDIYPPTKIEIVPIDEVLTVPTVVYFHGGGLTVGDRQSWFPSWLYKQTVANGFAFVSADYRLLPPAAAHEVSQDIQDVLRFLVSTEIALSAASNTRLRIDSDAIAVSGSSAGGLCTYFAAMHCVSVCPKAMISMYGMGANFLTSHYIQPKTKPFFRGRELLDPNDFLDYLHPTHQPYSATGYPNSSLTLPPISSSPLAYHPQTYRIPGYPANPRMFLARLYLQMGNYLDYYTGHWGLSDKLRPLLPSEGSQGTIDAEKAKQVIPASLHRLFPQFMDLKHERWPATFLIHGTHDSAVPVQESIELAQRLREAGVENVVLREVEGKEHSFDYEPGAEEEPELARLWDEVGAWMRNVLGSR